MSTDRHLGPLSFYGRSFKAIDDYLPSLQFDSILVFAACSAIYLKYANKHVNGGTYVPNVNDSPSCRSACDSRANCVGYDITSNGECWLTVNAAAQRNEVIAGAGVDHYAKVMKCDSKCVCLPFVVYALLICLILVRLLTIGETNRLVPRRCRLLHIRFARRKEIITNVDAILRSNGMS